jgi:hypothetical protein
VAEVPVSNPLLLPALIRGSDLFREPKWKVRRDQADDRRRLIWDAGVPLQRHRISDGGILAAYAPLRARERGGTDGTER